MAEKRQIRAVQYQEQRIQYQLTWKSVKNINLRVDREGQVKVSANERVPVSYIDEFVSSNGKRIIDAMEQLKRQKENRTKETELAAHKSKEEKEQERAILYEICHKYYPIIEQYGFAFPEVKIREMTSRWGSCRPTKGRITLNSRLAGKPREATEYVVLHELAHFVYPNHSKGFYQFIETYMPDWKERERKLMN